MLGRLYAVFFIFIVAASLWYQRYYLKEAAELLELEVNTESSALPTSTASNFNSNSYENGVLKYSFSGNNITYYTDNHFEATGNLVYKAYNAKKQEIATIRTNRAFGTVESDDETTLTTGANSKLKDAVLPDEVEFNFNGNKGKTSHVFIDIANQKVESKKSIESRGPAGSFKGTGFSYLIKEEEFNINSKVEGQVEDQNLGNSNRKPNQ